MDKSLDNGFSEIIVKRENETINNHNADGTHLESNLESNLDDTLECYSSATHSGNVNDKPYKCYNCKLIFSFDSELRTHMLIHTVENPFQCNVCCECFSNIFALKKHILGEHLIEKSEIHHNPSKSDDDSATQTSVDHKQHTVHHYTSEASESSKAVDDLYDNQFHSIKMEIEESIFHEGSDEDSRKDDDSSNEDCSKKTKVRRVRKRKGDVICDVCNKTFEFPSELKAHKMTVHIDGRPFPCKLCGKRFKKKGTLNEHLIIHSGIKPFGCDHCDMKFPFKSALNQHKKRHKLDKSSNDANGKDKNEVQQILPKDGTSQDELTVDGKIESIVDDKILEAYQIELPGLLNEVSQSTIIKDQHSIEMGMEAEQSNFNEGSDEDLPTNDDSNDQDYGKKTKEKVKRKGNVTCNICSKEFKFPYELERHKTAHTGERPFSCEICNKRFKLKGHLKEHLVVHTGNKRFSCEFCDKKFQKFSRLNLHIKRHFGGEINLNEVDDPEVDNNVPKDAASVTEATDNSDLGTNPPMKSDFPYFGCGKCDESFVDIESLKAHKITHRAATSSGANDTSDNAAEKNDLKPLRCNACSKTYMGFRDLQAHVAIHTGEKPYKCEFCRRAFRRLEECMAHQKVHGVVQNPKQCTYCTRKFFLQHKLDDHIKEHERANARKCPYCGLHSQSNKSLEDHILIHTGEKPHTCDVCGKTFRQLGTLNSHKRIHAAVKPFLCEQCGHGCATKKGRDLHVMNYHTGERPFQCEYCGRRFLTAWHLSEHVRVHTGEKPFECSTCGKAFHTRQLMREHEVIHKDDRPFQCTLCGNGFKKKGILRQHMRTHRHELKDAKL